MAPFGAKALTHALGMGNYVRVGEHERNIARLENYARGPMAAYSPLTNGGVSRGANPYIGIPGMGSGRGSYPMVGMGYDHPRRQQGYAWNPYEGGYFDRTPSYCDDIPLPRRGRRMRKPRNYFDACNDDSYYSDEDEDSIYGGYSGSDRTLSSFERRMPRDPYGYGGRGDYGMNSPRTSYAQAQAALDAVRPRY